MTTDTSPLNMQAFIAQGFYSLRCAIATPETNGSVTPNMIDLYGIIAPIILVCLLKLFSSFRIQSKFIYVVMSLLFSFNQEQSFLLFFFLHDTELFHISKSVYNILNLEFFLVVFFVDLDCSFCVVHLLAPQQRCW